MINSVTIENPNGKRLELILRDPAKSGFAVERIDGLEPPKATINIAELSSIDGSVFTSARISKRDITLNLIFLEDPTIEDVRKRSYEYFALKTRVKVEVDTDRSKLYTYGYVEANTPNIFSEREGSTVTIVCPDPYFYDFVENELSYTGIKEESGFEFPFSNEQGTKTLHFGEIDTDISFEVHSPSGVPCGVTFSILASGPIGNVIIKNDNGNQTMGLNFSMLEEILGRQTKNGDIINISTLAGKKEITITNYQDSMINESIIGCFLKDSDWIQLRYGSNILSLVGSGIERCTIYFKSRLAYEGV